VVTLLIPIIGDVRNDAPIGFVPVVVEAAAYVMNVKQTFVALAILGKVHIVLKLSGRGIGLAVVPIVMLHAIFIGNNNND
jgi:hypothetical protein